MPRHAVARIHAIKSICGLVVGFGILGLDQTLLFGEDPLGGSCLLVWAAREHETCISLHLLPLQTIESLISKCAVLKIL